jgi:hypothetical protein
MGFKKVDISVPLFYFKKYDDSDPQYLHNAKNVRSY